MAHQSDVQHLLSKDVDACKHSLQLPNPIELETLRVERTRRSLEHEARLRRVDERVAEHVAEIHAKLQRFYEGGRTYVHWLERSGTPSKEKL